MSEPSQRPPIASSPLSVLLFAQALSTETADALKGWQTYLDTLRRPYEIFLIQETRPEVVAEAAPAARIFPYERGFGFRDALNSAIRSAQYSLLVFCTCDKQYQPADLDRFLKTDDPRKKPPIDETDLVVGFRAGGQAPFWRVLLDTLGAIFARIVLGMTPLPRVCWLGSAGRGRRWIARWIFGVRVHDPECPFRLVRREVFARLPIQSGGPFVQVEMLAKANHLSCLLAEEPVAWTPPALEASDAISFGQDARIVFRAPDFGPPTPPRLALAENAPLTPSQSDN
jgi:glycosyltransferase involved in cell wall biosynthesis